MHRIGMLLGICLVMLGCRRHYEIEGEVVVTRGVPDVDVPAVLCVGRGGPLETSGVYGRPAGRTKHSSEGTIFCGPSPQEVEFPLYESIYYGSIPRRAHVYAWFAPVPAAVKLCAEGGEPTIQVDQATLDRLMSPDDAEKSPGERAPVSYPCGRNPTPDMPMAFAVTFDPANKTWSEAGARWIERRDLRIE